MLKFLTLVLAVATFQVQAMPKKHTNAEALAHVLNSNSFAKYVLEKKELSKGQLTRAYIEFKEVADDLKEGDPADGNYYVASFVYLTPQAGGAPDLSCSFSANVPFTYLSKPIPTTGGTAMEVRTKLLPPKFSVLACRQ